MTLPDYSEYLKKPNMLDWIESEWINKPEIHDFHAGVINELIKKIKKPSAIEIGCGTGNVAKRININVYVGIDLNEDCLRLAKEKNTRDKYTFISKDIRSVDKIEEHRFDLVFTFGFLKHFGLHEWNEIFKKICSLGQYLVFDIPISSTKESHDDGIEYHHVWKSWVDILTAIKENGFEMIECVAYGVEPVFVCKRK